MSFRKLTHAFNRAVTHGAYIAVAGAASLGIGIGVDVNMHKTWDIAPPVANVQMHTAELDHLHKLSADIVNAQYKIDFADKSIATAQQTLGQKQDAKSLGESVNTLQDAFDKNQDARQQQQERLESFRKDLLLNPTLSESEAHDIYLALWDKAVANQLGDIQNFFSPFSDALKMRDETIGAMHLPRDAAKVSDAEADQLLTNSRAAADDLGGHALGTAALDGFEALAGFLSLTALGAFGRRRGGSAPQPAPESPATNLRVTVTSGDDKKKRDGYGFIL